MCSLQLPWPFPVCGAGRQILSQLLKAFQLPARPLQLSVCFRTSSANANPSAPGRLLSPGTEPGRMVPNAHLLAVVTAHVVLHLLGFWAGFRFVCFLRCCIAGAKEPRAPPGHPAAALRGAWCGCLGARSVQVKKNQPTHPAFPFLKLKMYQEYFVALVYMCKYSSFSKV